MLQKLKQLFGSLVVYGVGDVATTVISFLLLPLYVRYLSPGDYGVLSLLLATEVVTKLVFRWGIDASFMRLYYDCGDQAAKQRLASTQLAFLAGMNGVLLAAALLAAPALARHLFDTSQYDWTLRLVLLNTFIVSFHYLPFHVMRMEGRPKQFIALTFSRSLATLVMRLVLVVGLHLGVLGVVLADVAVTLAFSAVLVRWFVPLVRPVFSRGILVESLRFGLPRLPHGMAHQVVAVCDRYILGLFVSLHELGLYSIGASFGLAMKLFLSAFEYAWAPFYFGTMNDPEAKRIFSRVTTYGVGILVLLVAILSATARDVVALVTPPEFHQASAVVPWIALGVALQGVYLLTSIGLNITKRTEYYPVATGTAAAVSVVTNLALIPRLGIVGAGIANALSYAVLAGVSWRFAQRHYPMTYEGGRLARLAAAGAGAYVVAVAAVPDGWHPAAGVAAGALAVLAVFPALLVATGFFIPGELARLRELVPRFRRRRTIEPPVEADEMAGELVAAPLTDTAEVAGDVAHERAEGATGEAAVAPR